MFSYGSGACTAPFHALDAGDHVVVIVIAAFTECVHRHGVMVAVAQFLQDHPNVEKVHYPGLEQDPGHTIATRQMQSGFGGMLSFLMPGGWEEAIAVACRAKVFKPATSLGGVESVLEHRKTSENETTDTPENLIRVSIGIENVEDLIADLGWMLD